MVTIETKAVSRFITFKLYIFIIPSAYVAGVPLSKTDSAKFSLESIADATLPFLHPLVEAGSDKCETLKSFFGLTYEQMQGRNTTDFHQMLHIDYITKNGSVKYNLTSTSIKQLTNLLIKAKLIVILIHGFQESSDGLMVQSLAPEYLKMDGEYEILALDGRKLINLEYFRSSTYARFMGEKLGNVMTSVIKNGIDPTKIKLVGHSLGAHIAGIAGKQVLRMSGMRIESITGLDPAGPCFTGVGVAGRLSKGDAVHVDVLHTNGGMLGLKEPVGDKDFFPNSGWTQPGCYFSTCDHSRAWELYAEAIANVHVFPARKCENWTMFSEGKCSLNEMVYMGPNSASGSMGNYFFTTSSKSPYGMGPVGSG